MSIEPEKGHLSVSSQGSNNSVEVSWTKPPGNVEYYTLQLNSTSKGSTITIKLSSKNNSFTFPNLSAGMFYSAVLTAHSGTFNASSDYVTNATCEYKMFVCLSWTIMDFNMALNMDVNNDLPFFL